MEDADPERLTPRQREIMELVAKGLTNPEICSVLSISAGTVKTHLAAIFRTLEVTNRTEAATFWIDAQTASASRPVAGPDGPNLIVLPFQAYSTEPEDAVLSDGLTEDVTSLLSRVPGLTVVGRSSAATLLDAAGNGEDARRAHEELGVRYAVEGSVRRTGNRLRVNVGLIAADTGAQLFAERWDREATELFAIEDELIDAVAGRLSSELTLAEARRVDHARPEDLGAWAYYQRALVAFHFESFTEENARRALALLDQALEREPDYVYALALRGMLLAHCVAFFWSKDLEKDREEALAAGHRSLTLAPDDPLVLQHWGSSLSLLEAPSKAVLPLQRAVEADPSGAHAWAMLGLYRGRTGSVEEAQRCFDRALLLSPRDPRRYLWHEYEGVVAIVAGDFERAADRCEAAVSLRDDQGLAWAVLALLLARLGRDPAAAAARARALRPGIAFRAALHLIRLHRPAEEMPEWKRLVADSELESA